MYQATNYAALIRQLLFMMKHASLDSSKLLCYLQTYFWSCRVVVGIRLSCGGAGTTAGDFSAATTSHISSDIAEKIKMPQSLTSISLIFQIHVYYFNDIHCYRKIFHCQDKIGDTPQLDEPCIHKIFCTYWGVEILEQNASFGIVVI